MKKIVFFCALLCFSFAQFSCNDEIPLTLQDEYIALDAAKTSLLFLRVNDGQPADAGIRAMLIAAHKSSDINFTFEIQSTSTAQENVHYTVSGTTGTIPAGSSFGELPIEILPDNINPGETWTLDIKITEGGGLQLANDNVVSFKIQVSCPSNLAGTLDFVHSDYFCTGDPITGTTELKEVSDGVYVFDDFVFGSWVACYGGGGVAGDDPAITLRMVDICNTISMTGTDNYGDSYEYKITNVNGPELTIDWTNTYGEFGKVVLTRQDGADWPALKN